ncbi:hypothetical protein GBA52_001064 [Prunus armeniaca]|nr:hypothetical protein GBA52_001064 [Prunus armeniaca]
MADQVLRGSQLHRRVQNCSADEPILRICCSIVDRDLIGQLKGTWLGRGREEREATEKGVKDKLSAHACWVSFISVSLLTGSVSLAHCLAPISNFSFKRTADDDIDQSVPFDLLDDDDPWIRTTDFTPSGAIGRCNSYRVLIPPAMVRLKKAMNYLRKRRVKEVCIKWPPRIQDEPDFGMSNAEPFFRVVACWPSKSDGFRLTLRTSMNKFESKHTTLEICSWTRYQPGFLNRQIITLLSTLKVEDEIFWRMQEKMVLKLNQMLVDTDVAFDVLTSSCAEQGNAAAIMLSAGFKPQTEPHLRGMLTCIQAAQLFGALGKRLGFSSILGDGLWAFLMS